jgi:hypothetical protein
VGHFWRAPKTNKLIGLFLRHGCGQYDQGVVQPEEVAVALHPTLIDGSAQVWSVAVGFAALPAFPALVTFAISSMLFASIWQL